LAVDDVVRRIAVLIFDLPPPLLRGDLDPQGRLAGADKARLRSVEIAADRQDEEAR
jgi:hypothetical protein